MREASFSLSDGLQSLQERRVGVVPGREEPIGEREAEVVPVQLNESRLQFLCKVHAFGEGVSLELKAAVQGRQHEGQQL